MNWIPTVALGAAVAASAVIGASTTASGASSAASENATRVYHAQLDELNDSGATGHATLQVRGTQLTVKLHAKGLAPGLVHAQHIHGIGNSECPTDAAAGPDGILSTADGLPFYGPIVNSLTTSGDTSPAAALDIEIMPVADEKGKVKYNRTFTVAPEVASNLGAFQIVQHGVDVNHNDAYDFGAGESELNPALPQEATAPANCGTIH